MPANSRAHTNPYDRKHRAIRKQALANLIDGTPCPFSFCQQPMYHSQPLDWDHTTRSITHAHCNRRHGQYLGEQSKQRTRRRRLPVW